MNFYKNVIVHRGKLLIRRVLNGKEYQEKLDLVLHFMCYQMNKQNIKHFKVKTLNLYDLILLLMLEDLRKKLETQNSPIFGLDRFHYQYIGQEYAGRIDWSREYIKIFTLDIETTCEDAFS